ncbi:MAG: prepilin-type N-terminal cleavage/methylation domain-containing protein [Verrucomicrobiota bacterium]|jgi:prepilin-type N-terminal cleavage/methylation domain-containing protein|nr:prepilin-type N-terminal cleavage/methylation domain-containing protein [Verrucomicrobiota bacterium]
MNRARIRAQGFTLIELLLALAIFTLVAAMAGGAFLTVTKAWNRGGEMLEQLHYGEFAIEQLVSALRGAAWFSSKPEAFGFWLDDSGGTSREAANTISWVTSGTAFLQPDSGLQNGLHRLSVTVESLSGQQGLYVRAWPHLVEDMNENDAEPWLVSPGVQGFSCEWYDFEEETWSQEWEETNSLPKLLRITLTMEKREAFDEHLELQRLVELEVAPELPGRERRGRSTDSGNDRNRENAATDAGGPGGTGSNRGGDNEIRFGPGGDRSTQRPSNNFRPSGSGPTLIMDGGPRGGGR